MHTHAEKKVLPWKYSMQVHWIWHGFEVESNSLAYPTGNWRLKLETSDLKPLYCKGTETVAPGIRPLSNCYLDDDNWSKHGKDKKWSLVLQKRYIGSSRQQNLKNFIYFPPSGKLPPYSSLLNYRGKRMK